MKKKAIAAVCAVVAIVVCATVLLAGCNNFGKYEFDEDNLAKGATVVDSLNFKNADAVLKSSGSAKTSDFYKRAYIDIDLGGEKTFNSVVLREETDNVEKFRLYSDSSSGWNLIYENDRIMKYRLCYTGTVTTSKIRVEILDKTDKVKLKQIEIYNTEKKNNAEFRVSDYMRMDYNETAGKNELVALKDDEGFYGNFNVITDVIVFGCAGVGSDGKLSISNGEEQWAEGFDVLRDAIQKSGRPIKIWLTVLFDQKEADGLSRLETTMRFMKAHEDVYHADVARFLEKYGIYGVDYDWEYPETGAQWKYYNKLIEDTAQYTHVSAALSNTGGGIKKETFEFLEYANIMLYDMFDERGCHSNFYNTVVVCAEQLINKGYPKEKLMLGIPTYGRSTNNSPDSWPTYLQLAEKYPDDPWINFYYDYPYSEGGVELRCDGYLNGYAMVRDKTAMALNYGVGGIMLFRMKCDAPYTYRYSCHRAVGEVMDAVG